MTRTSSLLFCFFLVSATEPEMVDMDAIDCWREPGRGEAARSGGKGMGDSARGAPALRL